MKKNQSGIVSWTRHCDRDNLSNLNQGKIIPPRLVEYIPRLVADIVITVDLNICNRFDVLAALLNSLPLRFDQM